MAISKILTHPGGAHKDDFLACSIMLARNAVSIERREPTNEDLNDVAVCVIDVGHRHEPELNNFDHHQFPRDADPTCALSLVLKNLDLYEDALCFCDWLEPAEWLDCRGAVETAKWLGVPVPVINQLNSPIDSVLLRQFANSVKLEEGEPLWQIMLTIGEDIIYYLKTMRERLDFLKEHSKLWEISHKDDCLRCLYIPRTEPLPQEPSMGMAHFVEAEAYENVVGFVYPDRRSNGYALSRFRDDKRLDFTIVSDEDDVHFAHARGFVAKTLATEEERLKELFSKALLES